MSRVKREVTIMWRGKVGGGLAIALLTIAVSGAAAADRQVGELAEGGDIGSTDVVSYMQLFGVDSNTAILEMSELGAVAALQDELESQAQDQFGGLWIDHQPYRVTVAVTKLTADVQTTLDKARLTDSPTVKLVENSLVTLTTAQRALDGIDIRHDSYIDVRKGQVVVEVANAADQSIVSAQAADLGQAPVSVDVVPQLAQPAALLHGGQGLYNWSGCPAGFTVRDHFVLGARTGFVTAGHCYGATFTYYGTALPYVSRQTAGNVDAMYRLDGNHEAVPSFIYNLAQQTRPQSGTSSTVVGQGICKYGPQTKYQCGTVDTITFSDLYWVTNAYGFVRAYNCSGNMVDGGDSGGPVFFGNLAYGLTSGYQPGACGTNFNMLIYGKITPALNALDVNLLLAP